jgi:hypothetical protein
VKNMTFPARRPFVRRWAGASAVVLLSSLALVACSDDDPVPTSGETREPNGSTRTPKPSEEPTSEPTASESPTDEGTAVPVYWVGDGPGGEPRLFREFHRVEGNPLTEAARLVMGGGQPDDPDYRTLWPEVEVADVGATDGILLVQVPGDGFTDRPDGMTKRDAELALQQLVYTLQGVQQERVPILIKRGGTDFRLFGLPTDTEFTQAGALETLNLVSITSPVEGATVTGDTLTVTGVANSFEASGPCRLLVDGVEMVVQGYQSDGWMEDRLFPFEVDIPLEGISGEAVVQCETDDPSGGAEGNGPSIDTKTITVR